MTQRHRVTWCYQDTGDQVGRGSSREGGGSLGEVERHEGKDLALPLSSREVMSWEYMQDNMMIICRSTYSTT